MKLSISFTIVFVLGFAGLIYILGWTNTVKEGISAASGYFFGAAALWTFQKWTRRKWEQAHPVNKKRKARVSGRI